MPKENEVKVKQLEPSAQVMKEAIKRATQNSKSWVVWNDSKSESLQKKAQ